MRNIKPGREDRRGMSYEVVNSEKRFEGKIMDILVDEITLPNHKTCVREYVVRHGHAAAIVPVDANGNIILVRQYRHPAKAMVLEIPAGMMEGEEEPLCCAKRELEEEIGYTAEQFTKICEMHSAVGICNEILYIYLAENLQPGHQHFDEDEFIEVETYSLDETIAMIFDGRITDSKTMAGVLGYAELLRQKKSR